MPASKLFTRDLMYILAFLGFFGTWGLSLLNGSLAHLFSALHETSTLPGTSIPLRTRISGIYWPVDYLLDVLIVFFWQAVDGSHPTTSIFGLYFAGQHVAVIATLHIDSLRKYNLGKWRQSATLWLMLFQLTAIATSGPWSVLLGLSRNPIPDSLTLLSRSQDELSVDSAAVRWLPLSISIGYILLVVLMGLPSSGSRALLDPSTQQLAVAAWNIFPIAIVLCQITLRSIASLLGPPSSIAKARKTEQGSLVVTRYTYGFAFAVCAITHIATIAIASSTSLFPSLFAVKARYDLSLSRIFSLSLSAASVPSLGQGALFFMQWDLAVGLTAMLVPAAMNYRTTLILLKKEANPIWLTFLIFLSVIAVGPGSTLVALRFAADEALLGQKYKILS